MADCAKSRLIEFFLEKMDLRIIFTAHDNDKTYETDQETFPIGEGLRNVVCVHIISGPSM